MGKTYLKILKSDAYVKIHSPITVIQYETTSSLEMSNTLLIFVRSKVLSECNIMSCLSNKSVN